MMPAIHAADGAPTPREQFERAISAMHLNIVTIKADLALHQSNMPGGAVADLEGAIDAATASCTDLKRISEAALQPTVRSPIHSPAWSAADSRAYAAADSSKAHRRSATGGRSFQMRAVR